jgi:hypothetical protein
VLASALVAAIVAFNLLRHATRPMLKPGDVLAIMLLRCERPFEAALTQRGYPQCLPRIRVELHAASQSSGPPLHAVQPLGGGGSPSPEKRS